MIDLSQISIDPDVFMLDVIDPDRIIVINLDRRPDRWESLCSAWDRRVVERFHRFSATDGRDITREALNRYQNGRELGDETAAAEEAVRQSWMRAVGQFGPAIYFEDDARPGLPWPFGLPPADAGIVLLGGDHNPKVRAPGWARVFGAVSGGHAVWIRSEHAATSLLETWHAPESLVTPADVGWNPLLVSLGAAIAVPQIVIQVDLGTDVQLGRQYLPGETTSYQPWCSLRGGEPGSLRMRH